MPLKTRDELLSLLNTAIRSAGAAGKTSAADIRGFLTVVIDEFLASHDLPALADPNDPNQYYVDNAVLFRGKLQALNPSGDNDVTTQMWVSELVGQFVPLAGTTPSDPITGEIELSGGASLVVYDAVNAWYTKITGDQGVRFDFLNSDRSQYHAILFGRAGLDALIPGYYLALRSQDGRADIQLSASNTGTLLVNGAEITGGEGSNTLVVEQNLASNSAASVPSVSGVRTSYRNDLTLANNSRNPGFALDARQGSVIANMIAGLEARKSTVNFITDPFTHIQVYKGQYYVSYEIMYLRTGPNAQLLPNDINYDSPDWTYVMGARFYAGFIATEGGHVIRNDSQWIKYNPTIIDQRAFLGQIWYVDGSAYRYINPNGSNELATLITGVSEFSDRTRWDPVVVKGAVSGSGPANTDALPEGQTNLYYTAARASQKAELVNGKLPVAQLPYTGFTPSGIRSDVSNGTFYQGELTTASSVASPFPAGSIPGMKFSANDGAKLYTYEFMLASADTDGTRFTWVRMVRG